MEIQSSSYRTISEINDISQLEEANAIKKLIVIRQKSYTSKRAPTLLAKRYAIVITQFASKMTKITKIKLQKKSSWKEDS